MIICCSFSSFSRRSLLDAAGLGLLAALTGASAEARPALQVKTLDALRKAEPAYGIVLLTAPGRGGLFRWTEGDFQAQVTKDALEGYYVASGKAGPSSGAWVRQGGLLTPEMFGAQATDADHSGALQALFDHIYPGIHVELSGQYSLSRGITIARKSDFTVGGGGALTMKAGAPVEYGYGLLSFVECRGFSLQNITLDGNRATRVPREAPAHSVIFQSCRNFACYGVHSLNAVCDGYFLFSATPEKIDTHCTDFSFVECVADNCFRQGCSIIHGKNGIFRGGSFTRSNGTAPEAGIDLECDLGDPEASIKNVVFDGVVFSENRGFGLLVSAISRPRDIVATDCTFSHNGAGAISWGATQGRIVRAKIDGFGPSAQRGAIDVPVGDGWLGGQGTMIEYPDFSGITTTRADTPLVYVHSLAYGPVNVIGLRANICGPIAGFGRSGCTITKSYARPSLTNSDGAISISGRDCIVAGNDIENFFGSAIVSTGSGTVIRGNILAAPRHNDRTGVVRVLGEGALIENNVISGHSAATAICVQAPPRRVAGNRITGFARKLATEVD